MEADITQSIILGELAGEIKKNKAPYIINIQCFNYFNSTFWWNCREASFV